MAGDEPSPSDDKDEPFDTYDEFDLLNLMSDFNPNLMDFIFNNTIPAPPPPPLLALPTIPADSNMDEVNQTQMVQEPSHEIPKSEDGRLNLSWEMIVQLSSNASENNLMDQFLKENQDGFDVEEIGRDGNINASGEHVRLEATKPVFSGKDGDNFETGGPSTAPVPLVTPTISEGIVVCSCCGLVRTIIHSNGRETMRLDMYGGNGYFCHGILEMQRSADGITERQHQTLHFTGLSVDDVQGFVEDYLLQREATRLPLAEDSNPSLFQTINNQLSLPTLPSLPMALARPEEALNVPSVPLYAPLSEAPPATAKEKKRRQTPLAAQRARTRKMTLKDLAPYFGIPIDEAARRLNICPTVAKKISRKGGLPRWPHRKIRSLNRRISTLQSVLRHARDPVVISQTQQEIARIQAQINEFCARILKQFPP